MAAYATSQIATEGVKQIGESYRAKLQHIVELERVRTGQATMESPAPPDTGLSAAPGGDQ